MLSWLTKIMEWSAPEPDPAPPLVDPDVTCDDEGIRLLRGDGAGEIAWSDLETVAVKARTARSAVDLVWLLTSRDGKMVLTVPMGAPGEADLVRVMQGRLAGFDNMAVVEAMSTAEDAEFQVWPPTDFTTV